MRYSVIIPALNEADNIAPLLAEVAQAMSGRDYEILVIDDGSSDQTAARVMSLAATDSKIRLIQHQGRFGQSRALRTGAEQASGNWIITLDGDGQNDPADIPALIKIIDRHAEGASLLVGGLREKRQDSFSRKLASRFANAVRAAALQDDCPDTGCSLKIFRRDDYLRLPFFNHQHRFLPALLRAYGATAIYVPVHHRPRQHGASKYTNWRRGLQSVADLLGVMWLIHRTPKNFSIQPKD